MKFRKEVNKLLKQEKFIKSKSDTIQIIFQIAMLTIYKDNENIKNVDDIQIIYEEKFIAKSKWKNEIDILEVIKEIKDKINSDKPHKSFLEFIIVLLYHLIIKEVNDLSISLSIDEIDPKDLIKKKKKWI